MAGEIYRFLLRMPTHLRERLTDATAESGRSLNAEIVNRLEESLADNPGVFRRLGLRTPGGRLGSGYPARRNMSPKYRNSRRATRRRRLVFGAVAVVVVLTTAMVVGALSLGPSSQTASPALAQEGYELSPAMRQKLANPKFSPGEPQRESGESGDGDLEWQMHATPGTEIPMAAITGSRADWHALKARGNASLSGNGKWTNLGPDNAVYPLNPSRNRFVYVPNEYVAGDFQHNNTAALELDPNDSTSNVIYAGTGEPNTCRSGCIAGVGLYKSKDGGNHWSGPIGTQYFAGRGIGSIQG